MRTLWLILLLPACIIDLDPSAKRVQASWTCALRVAGETACPLEWTAVELALRDDRQVRTATRFDATGHGVSKPFAPGTYTAWLDFFDGGSLVTSSLPETIEIHEGMDTPLDATIYLDGGYVGASWTWGDRPRQCHSDNPFEQVWISLRGGESGGQYLFDCNFDWGITPPLTPGHYHASVGQGFDGHDLGDLDVDPLNHVTTLPQVTL